MNLPQCLTNVIGSRNSEWNIPSDFSLYVEQLPAISNQAIVSMRPSDDATGEAFLRDKINFAMQNIVVNLSQWLTQDFRQGSILDRHSVGFIPKGTITYNTTKVANRGVKITRTRNDFYGLLRIDRVKVILNNSGAFNLIVTDNIGHNQSIAFTAVAGVPTEVNVNYTSQAGTAFVTIDNTVALTAQIKTASCCDKGYDDSHKGGFRVEGYDSTDPNVGYPFTFGLIFEYTYECDQKLLACLFRNSVSFQMACLYRCGMDLLDELFTTYRANPKTIHISDETKEQRDKFEVEYTRALEILRVEARKMLANPKTDCLACNGTRYVETQRQFNGNFNRR